MKRLAYAPLAALALATAAPAAAAPRLLLPPTSATVVKNDLVATARGTLLARDPTLAKVALAHEATVPLNDGRAVVRFSQRHAGIPVLSRGATVLLDASGAPTRIAAAHTQPDLPPLAAPAIDAASAAKIATSLARTDFSAADGRLAWLPAGRSARLVWTFHRRAAQLPFAPAIAIDADDGSIALATNAVSFDRAATVHTINPVTTPSPSEVVLDALAPGAPALTTPKLRVQNCIDEGTLTSGQYPIHACVAKQMAVADANGDFPYTFVSDTAQEDEYAEVVMFYHASKAYAYFNAIGMPDLEAQPLDLMVNLRLPAGFESFDFSRMSNPNLPLEPYNNAFFTTQNPFFGSFGPDGPSLWFGQGIFTDFAYDGDVVYHEFGHAMVDRTVKLVHHWHLDSQGATVSPGAMNEGLADYFSSGITGDGKVGEYAAQNFFQAFAGNIRDLDNDHSCPSMLSGEVHSDSTLFSGGLWSIRKPLDPAQQQELDAAVMTALLAAPSGDLGYEDMAELIVAAVEASPLGKTVADALAVELTTRGVLPACNRVIEHTGQLIMGPEPKLAYSFVAPGTFSVTLEQQTPFVPGLFQVHVKLEPDTTKVRVSIEEVHGGQEQWNEGQPYEPALLARFDTTPIEITYDNGYASSNAGEPVGMDSFQYAEIEVPDGATDLYLMVVNLGDQDGRFTNFSVFQQSAPTATGGTGGKPGTGGSGGLAGAGGTTSAEPEDGAELSPAGGCACRTPSAPANGAPLWLAALAALGLLRRRGR